MKIAVLGAGGFVGATLCERRFFEKGWEVVPVIHSFSSAARLARLPLTLRVADVVDAVQVRAATQGCDAIVNCSRGDELVMRRGLRNIIAASRANHIQRIVHVSSIAIYGSNPPKETEDESAAPCPDDPYGVWKTAQDEMLFKAHRSGIGVILLCPANIYGPFSPFIVGVARHLQDGTIRLVDGGGTPTNHVHVYNVVEAMIAALRSNAGWGERYFVNEVERVSWREFYEDMSAMLGLDGNLPSVSREEVQRACVRHTKRAGVMENIKIACSGEFRQALSILPAFRALNEGAYRRFIRLNPRYQQWLHEKMARPTVIAKQLKGPRLDHKFIREQLKTVYHSPARIMRTLSFRPFTYRQGMETVREWWLFAADYA
jgi:nucleoside-diphosphate-sugar epimerase